MTGQLRILQVFGLAAALLSVAGAERAAADYLLTATGNFVSSDSLSYGFDGTTDVEGQLPSLYDTARLEGGSFVATYRFSTIVPPASGNIANYAFSSPAGLSYVLLDPTGAVVHIGSNTSAPAARVFNNLDGYVPGAIYDEVYLGAFVNDVSGLMTPLALYQPAPDLIAFQSVLIFGGDVTAGSDLIPSLALPTDAATYLGFPSKIFRTAMSFNDGDVYGLEGGPYQYGESYLQYAITNVTVTAVPEPATGVMLLVGMLTIFIRRRVEIS